MRRPVIEQSPRGRCRRSARTAACLVHLDHPENRAETENPVDLARPDHLASLANHRRKSARSSRHHPASHVHLANLANLDLKAHLAIRDHLDHLATLAKTANLAALDLKDHPDHPDHPAQTAHEANLANQLSALQLLPATPDQLAQTDLQDQLVIQERKETTVPLATQAPRAHQDLLVQMARMEHLATKDHLDPTDQRESRVSAPNIAPWTAVSSSKTAQDAKRIARDFLQNRRRGYGESLLLFAVYPALYQLFSNSK